ncbi:MAG: MotA/TolQ/ExbB proton channel family protein [Gemmataceae bacterium]|nr:MotA/TolQ/ExbB proton channel family protein [Gemmataceae bacterium]
MLRFADLKGYLIPALVMLFVFGLLASTPTSARAQDNDPPAEEKKDGADEGAKTKSQPNRFVHFFQSIGWLFGIIFLVVSIGTVALIIVLLFDLKLSEAMNPDFVNEFTGLVNKRQFKQAFELCKNDTSFLARVMTAGMGRLQYGIEDAREAMIGMVETIKASKEGLISYLASIGTLGPMLGLVGTVSGMIGAFYKLGTSEKAANPQELAGEISHALVVTLVGVAVSVPAIFFYSFFKNRLTSISHHTSNLADDLLTQMYHNSKKQTPAPTA